jgi:flagellar hook-associated protein 3 FlgL
MRIASTQYSATVNTALQNASAQLEALMTKMSSGKKLNLPSDDPITSVRLSRLTREEAALDQYRSNIGSLRSRLQQSEVYLDSINGDMLQARDLLVAASDGSNTPDDLAARATPLAALRDSLFYTANSKDQEGRYVFSGTASATPAVSYDATQPLGQRYSFTGNTDEQKVVVGNGVVQTSNVSLPEMAALLNQLDSAAGALQSPSATANDPALHGALASALDGVDSTMDAVSSKVNHLGGAQNLLGTMDTNHANVSLSNQQALIDLGQLDYADAAVKLNGYTSALQATQKTYAKVSALSLFDVL